jgi:hypothetical protein
MSATGRKLSAAAGRQRGRPHVSSTLAMSRRKLSVKIVKTE